MSETPLWTPTEEQVAASNMTAFRYAAEAAAGRPLPDYDTLHAWSVEDPATFWQTVWSHVDIVASRPADTVIDDPKKMPGAKWFDGARLNFAENLLRFRDDRPAIVFRNEAMPESRRITFAELHDEVAAVAAGLREAGVVAGDRVVGFMPNMPETIIAMLAAASVGAIWSSCSPDFGIKGVLDRFARIEPKVLFTADAYFYGGKRFDSLEKVAGILAELGSTPKVVVVGHVESRADLSRSSRSSTRFTSCTRRGRRVCPSASFSRRAASCSTSSRSTRCTSTSVATT
jgi:acetoacetyl-CoA synthetase